VKRLLFVAAIGLVHIGVALAVGAAWWVIVLIAAAFIAAEALLIGWRARRAALQGRRLDM